jgi:glycosyltransferase involved in cell wall biosynthesis
MLDLEGPRITVIVAVLNSASTLQRCIDSFQNQTYPHKELIVIDGGSIDGSKEILIANGKSLTHWESKPDRGIYHAWNKGLKAASGEWICFLGANDYFWDNTVLMKMVPELVPAKSRGQRIVYGQVAYVSPSGEMLYVLSIPWQTARRKLKHLMPFNHSGSFCHRHVFDEHGVFNETFRIAGDYEFVLRELRYRDAHYVPNVIVNAMTFGGISSSMQGRTLTVLEYYRARAMNGLHGFSWHLTIWYVRVILGEGLRRVFGDRFTHHVADGYRLLTGRKPVWTK